MPASLALARPIRRRSHASLALALLLAACASPSVDAPLSPPDAARVAKAAAPGLTVASANPKFGDRGTTLDVHVIGSGFTDGAQATWLLHGVADPAHVRTNSTTFVSSTEVVANITVASDANLAYWDVQIALRGGKNGVGSELFEITTATPVGPGAAYGVNDAGDIAGLSSSGAYVVSGADASFSDLGPRKATGISQDGLVAVGSVNGSDKFAGYPGVWTRAVGARWPATGAQLRDLQGMTQADGLAYAVAAIPAEGVTVITGVLPVPGTPVYWVSTDGTWTTPARALPMPAGYLAGTNAAVAIAANGDITGQLQSPGGNLVPVVWRRGSGTYVAILLPLPPGYAVGRPRSISPDGTILAGNVRVSSTGKDVLAPAFWMRDANGVYTVRVLPTLTGANGGLNVAVYGVTVVGGQVRAVGASPSPTNGTWLHAVCWTWTVGGSDFVVRDIGGVGTKTDVTPYAINAAGTIAVGADGTGSIRWRLLP